MRAASGSSNGSLRAGNETDFVSRKDDMELPTWEQCRQADDEERATELEAFIHCNEPEGEEDAAQFRSMLLAVLEEATAPAVPQATHHCPNCEAAAREHAELQALCDRQAELLTSVARALRGPEPPLIDYGWADLPERAKVAVQELADIAAVLRTGSSGDTLLGKEVSRWIDITHAVEQERDDARELAFNYKRMYTVETEIAQRFIRERDDLRAGILRVIEDYPRDIKQDAEEALRALLAETEGERPA